MQPEYLNFTAAAALLLGTSGAFALDRVTVGRIADPVLARADYIENCGGCHGIQGSSAPAAVPQLRDRVGWFLCTPESRAYLIRLPNVAHSRLTDNAQLADMLNYVVFDLGGMSAPANAPAFTGAEVARQRGHPLSGTALKPLRARLVERLIRACKAPASMRLLYPIEPRHP